MYRHDMHLIRPSITRIFSARRSIGSAFYARLFEREPAFRKMFPAELGKQARAFDEMIALIAKKTNDPEAVKPVLEDIGNRYRSYGTRPHHLPMIGEVFLAVLREETPGGLTSEEAEAWQRSFERAAEVVAQRLLDPPAVWA